VVTIMDPDERMIQLIAYSDADHAQESDRP
jgi:hypothetical protein